MNLSRCWFLGLLSAGAASGAAPAKYLVTVPAEPYARAGQVVEMPLPADWTGSAGLRDQAGRIRPLQRGEGNRGIFLIPAQAPGEKLVLELVPLTASDNVRTAPLGRQLDLRVQGQPAVSYQMDRETLPRADIDPKHKRAGYLHPLFTPGGVMVSDDFPKQHIHHHGLWEAWTKAKFQGRNVEFWDTSIPTGTIEFVGLDRIWSGPVEGGFSARQRFVDLSVPGARTTILNETWNVRLYDLLTLGSDRMYLFDLTTVQTCATSDPLVLPQYHYGGLGFRGRAEWLVKPDFRILTSEGETDRIRADNRKARWIYVGGVLGNGQSGVAILCHPGNFRAPQAIRVNPLEPFVCYTPTAEGDWAVGPSAPYIGRYRLVVFDGPPQADRLNALWNGYALAAAVKVDSVP